MDTEKWFLERFGVDVQSLIEALELNPSSEGYIHGAVSEWKLLQYLRQCGYKVYRIKEKPAGGNNEKKEGYKGDFLIEDNGSFYVIECKGIKTNAEFRIGETDKEYTKSITRDQAFRFLCNFINIDKSKIYQTGLKTYQKKKKEWETKHPGESFPPFRWTKDNPGPDSPDLTFFFQNSEAIQAYVNSLGNDKFTESAFRSRQGAYIVIQTHKPSGRTDPQTHIHMAAPLVSDFSILAVDMFQRTGKHDFVFVNPNTISHSPGSPNHLYQNYIIDIIIPGKKDTLEIVYPWYRDLQQCIKETHPRTVDFDPSQLDHR